MIAGQYIYKKEIDWSVLHQGFTFPVSFQVEFQQLVNQKIPRGITQNIRIIIDGITFDAKLVNQNFDEEKYPKHKDIIQIRYLPSSQIAKYLRLKFSDLFEYFLTIKKQNLKSELKKKIIPIPENLNQYLFLYTTQSDDTFVMEYITNKEHSEIQKNIISVTEEEFELNTNYHQIDQTATIKEKIHLVKIRKLDRSICNNLKLLYDYRCQITGEKFGVKYNSEIVEAHHIDYFTKSLNNNSENIIIISPNFHRLIHKTNPIFDRKEMALIFSNGVKEKLKLNYHL